MSDKTATDRLRAMLDERGVKWWPMRNNGYYEDRDTEFVVNGRKYTAHEWGDGLCVYGLTPEQAIAATLGSGTCELKGKSNTCTKCGASVQRVTHSVYEMGDGFACHPNYYPNCGAKIRKAVSA